MVGAQQPRIKVVPKGAVHPQWAEVQDFVKALGVTLDDWQWMVLYAALLRTGDIWAAFAIAACVPRQNGKNGILEIRQLLGAHLFKERLQVHTAHLTDTSKEAFRRLDELLEANEWLSKDVKHIWRANGMESIEFKGGRRIRFRTRTRGGGRGYAGASTVYFDESMFLPEVSMGSILPVISANPDSQIWYMGSAVDQQIMDDGMVFSRVRSRALSGESERLAYFEWSLKADTPDDVTDEMAADPKLWAETNPAFGVRITPDYVKVERGELDLRTFAVERLGVGDWPAPNANTLALEHWDELIDAQSALLDPVCLAFDVSPARTWASIAAAGKRSDGLEHVELVENRRGTGWLVDRLAEVVANQRPFAVICDKASPAASLVPELEEANVTVELIDARDYANACGVIFDKVEQRKLRHLGQKEMRDALRGAATRPLGDAWAWSRKSSSANITPLVAGTLAIGKSATHFGGGEYVLDYAALLEDVAA